MKQLKAEEIREMLEQDKSLMLLDVRSKEEIARGKIEGSVHIPVDEIRSKIESVVPEKNTKIIVYCLSGSRSFIAAEILEDLGYTNTFDMANGLMAWRSRGYPLANS